MLLSFDSDTDKDAEDSGKLWEKLNKLKIPATFAVPGVQLENGSAIYKSLHRDGAKFINHGGAAHTAFKDGRYWSVNFYNQMSSEEVREDIRLGHAIFESVIGEAPKGFRAPHFGHFQGNEDLALVHDELANLGGYSFSTSSLSYRSRKSGPIIRMNDTLEIPVTGSYEWPTRLFDSYGHLISKEDRRVTDQYAQKLRESIEQFSKREMPAVLNYYADPSHVASNNAYFEVLEEAVERGVKFIDFDQLLNMVRAEK